MIGEEIADGGGGIASPAAQAEEDVDDRLDWAGCDGLRTEVLDGLTADDILLIVKGDEKLGGLAELLDGSILGEEKISDEEHKVHEGLELDRLAVASALRVFVGLEVEVEVNGDQFDDVVGSGIR